MTADLARSYDELPYADRVFGVAHPDNLATVGALMGLQPPDTQQCRILELGCAAGSNLMAVAVTLPQSECVGIDLSPRQIERGEQIRQTLGLNRVQLRAENILELDRSLGTFDYIICHGVYSWVPPVVQEKILQLMAELLSPQGIGYISYNTYPGWHFRGLLRDMMRFHVRRLEQPLEMVQAGRALLDYIDQTLPHPDFYYARVLKEEIQLLRPEADSYLYHEHLEEYNEPLYFHQFAARLQPHGLQYVGEAEPHPIPGILSPESLATLQGFSHDLIDLEQYLDFLAGRPFRRTLVCHREVRLPRQPGLLTIGRLHVNSVAQPKTENPDLFSAAPVDFETRTGVTLSTAHPLVKVALYILSEQRPRFLAFPDLCSAVRARMPEPPPITERGDPITQGLAEALLRCYQSHLVDFRLRPPSDVQQISERPVASPLARLQAANGITRVTNLRNQVVPLKGFDCVLLPMLTGEYEQPQLVEKLLVLAQQGIFDVQYEGKVLRDEATLRLVLQQWLREGLIRLVASSLLAS